jgi:hypothetical protein
MFGSPRAGPRSRRRRRGGAGHGWTTRGAITPPECSSCQRPRASRVLLEYPEGGKGGKSLGQALDDAMRAIERDNPQLAGVLPKTYQQFNARLLKELLKTFSTRLPHES